MRRVPDREAARGLHAGQVESRHERRADERRCGQERDGVEPGMSIERFRSRGEVEDRESNRRKRQGTRNPCEDGQHLMERQRQHPLGVEERSATADGAERERKYAEPGGDVVAAHQQEQDCRAGEHRHLDDHPEVTSCPPVGVRTKDRRPVEQEPCESHRLALRLPSRRLRSRPRGKAHATPRHVRRSVESRSSKVTLRDPSARCSARSRLPATIPAASAGLPGATRVISGADVKSLTTLGGRALSGR